MVMKKRPSASVHRVSHDKRIRSVIPFHRNLLVGTADTLAKIPLELIWISSISTQLFIRLITVSNFLLAGLRFSTCQFALHTTKGTRKGKRQRQSKKPDASSPSILVFNQQLKDGFICLHPHQVAVSTSKRWLPFDTLPSRTTNKFDEKKPLDSIAQSRHSCHCRLVVVVVLLWWPYPYNHYLIFCIILNLCICWWHKNWSHKQDYFGRNTRKPFIFLAAFGVLL